MSMTLTDRLTRGTYLFDNGEGQPGVICLTYSWMSDALKMLPPRRRRGSGSRWTRWRKIYPDVDIARHIIGDPITVSWEADRHFLGAFKGALPGPLPVQPAHVRPLHAGRHAGRSSAASSSPATTSPGRRRGSRGRCRPR